MLVAVLDFYIYGSLLPSAHTRFSSTGPLPETNASQFPLHSLLFACMQYPLISRICRRTLSSTILSDFLLPLNSLPLPRTRRLSYQLTKPLVPHSFQPSLLDSNWCNLPTSKYQLRSKTMSASKHFSLRNNPQQQLPPLPSILLPTLQRRPLFGHYLDLFTFTFLEIQKRYDHTHPPTWRIQFLPTLHPFQQFLLFLHNFRFVHLQICVIFYVEPLY